MTKRDLKSILRRVADAMVEDILDMSNEEVRAKMREEGLDPDQEAAKIRAVFEAAADKKRH